MARSGDGEGEAEDESEGGEGEGEEEGEATRGVGGASAGGGYGYGYGSGGARRVLCGAELGEFALQLHSYLLLLDYSKGAYPSKVSMSQPVHQSVSPSVST